MSAQSPSSHGFDHSPLTTHEYDGIREYDNPTPGWWHIIFIVTIIFSALYATFWHTSPLAWTVEEGWSDDQKAEWAKIFGTIGDLKPDEATVLSLKDDVRFMAIAKGTFLGTCAACHGPEGGGLSASGVNLCDDSYKNITKVDDLFNVITNGANNGAMPAHANRFSQNERVLLAAYVASLRGTTPAIAQPAEGVVIAPWPKVPDKAFTPASK